MTQTDGDQSGSLGALAALLLLAGVAWAATQRKAEDTEVTLHKAALAATEEARRQIHLARRAAEALRGHAVEFDVEAKLAAAFTEPLPPVPKTPRPQVKPDRPPMFFMIDSNDRLPALRTTVDRLLHGATDDVDGAPSRRLIVRQAMDREGGLWSAERSSAVLTARGLGFDGDRPLNVVGNLLAAMARDGEIRRVGRGMYTSLGRSSAAHGEQEVAPGVFAKETSPGVWMITGFESASDLADAA